MNNLQNTCNFKISCFLLTYLISHPVKCKFELDRQMFFWEMGDKITCEISHKLSDCIYLYYLSYRISANSFRGNYSFLNLALFTVTFDLVAAEPIQGRKLFKGGNYSRKYGTFIRNASLFLFSVYFLLFPYPKKFSQFQF